MNSSANNGKLIGVVAKSQVKVVAPNAIWERDDSTAELVQYLYSSNMFQFLEIEICISQINISITSQKSILV